MASSQCSDDPRWDNRIRWYLRHTGATVGGNLDLWLDLVGQRVERLFVFNEVGVLNESHLGSSLETETLGRFKFTWGSTLGPSSKHISSRIWCAVRLSLTLWLILMRQRDSLPESSESKAQHRAA